MDPTARTLFFAEAQTFLNAFTAESVQAFDDNEGFLHVSETYGAMEHRVEIVQWLFAHFVCSVARFALNVV